MRRGEFLAWVNAERLKRFSLPPISDGVLADWLEVPILEAPEKRGRSREWGEEQFIRAMDISRLNSLGLSILGEIGFHIWLASHESDDLELPKQLREILIREFTPLRTQLTSPIRSTYPETKNTSPEGFPAKSVLRGMGELDPTLADVIAYAPDEKLSAYSLMRYGNASGSFAKAARRLTAWTGKALAERYPHNEQGPDVRLLEPIATKLFAKVLAPSTAGNALEISIRNSTDPEILKAREAFHTAKSAFNFMGLKKVARSLEHPTWEIGLFILLLHWIVLHRRKSGAAPQAIDLTPELSPK